MKKLVCRLIFSFVFIVQAYAVESALFHPETIIDPVCFTVSIKNVGQGSCTIIRNHENNHFLIIDAGSLADKPQSTEACLRETFGFSEVNSDIPLTNNSITAIISHSDKDHINLFENIFSSNQFLLERVARVYLGDHFANYFRIPATRQFLTDFLKKIPGIEGKLVSLSHELASEDILSLLDKESPLLSRAKYYLFQSIKNGDGFLTERQRTCGHSFEFLGTNAGAGTDVDEAKSEEDTNINSAIVRLNIAGHNILIMGDATGQTTERILDALSDPAILKADLLIASHHGAENDDTNHITWAAITQAKRVAFSSGFHKGIKHPTLAAISNYLITGLESDRIYSDPLWGLEFPHKDAHNLSIFNKIGKNIGLLKPHVAGLEWVELDKTHEEWGIFRTERPIYSTGSSGDLHYTFSSQGKLVRFQREY